MVEAQASIRIRRCLYSALVNGEPQHAHGGLVQKMDHPAIVLVAFFCLFDH